MGGVELGPVILPSHHIVSTRDKLGCGKGAEPSPLPIIVDFSNEAAGLPEPKAMEGRASRDTVARRWRLLAWQHLRRQAGRRRQRFSAERRPNVAVVA